MEILIVLIVILGIGIIICNKYGFEMLGFLITFFSGLYLLIHITSMLTATYSYEILLVEREAFETTLKESRENGAELEAAAILREVTEFNISLARDKYDAQTFFYHSYYDDRILDVQPIK